MTVRYPVLSTDLDSPPLPDPSLAPDGQTLSTLSGAYVLGTPGGGIDTSWQVLPDTGWTASLNSGTAGISGGTVTINVTGSYGNQGACLSRSPFADAVPMGVSYAPNFEFRARMQETAGVNARSEGISWSSGAFTAQVGYRIALDDNNQAIFQRATAAAGNNGWTQIAASSGGVSSAPGLLWFLLQVTPLGVAAYYGFGVGVAPPATWTFIGVDAANVNLYLNGGLQTVSVFAGRRANDSNPYTVLFNGMAVRSLLGPAP